MAVQGQNSLFFSSGIDNSGLQSGASDAVGIVQGLASSIGAINPFAILATGAVAAFGVIANSAYQMMKDFESAMAEVKTIANVSEQDFDKLQEKVFSLSSTLGTETPAALANGLYDIIGAGYDASEALELLEISTKAATAGVTTSAVAADGLTTILNAFKLEASEASKVADQMFQIVNLGKISFSELSSQIAQVAPLAAASGFSFQEIGAAIATLTKQGVPASQAMTQIRSGIISVSEVLGSGASKALTLQGAFQELFERAGGDQDKLKVLAGRIEAVSAILSIAGPNFKGATQDLIEMSNAAGSVNKSFEIITSTTASQWEILWNRVKATTENIGNAAVEISNGVAGILNNIVEETQDLTESVRKQSNQYDILVATLKDVNTPFDRKLEILKELKETYPGYLESLDIDKVKNDNLEGTLLNVAGALEKINDEHERRLKLSGINQEVLDQKKLRDEYQDLSDKNKENFFATVEEIRDFAARENIPLNFSLSDDVSTIYRKLRNQLDAGPFSDGGDLIASLLISKENISLYTRLLGEANRELKDRNNALDEETRKLRDNAEGYREVVKEIEKVNDLSELSQYGAYEFPKIKEALAERKKLLTTFGKIDQTENIKSLKPFLESEIEEIKKYAEKRKRFLNTDYDGKGAGKEGGKTYLESLEEKRKAYKEYTVTIDQLGKESADNIFKNLLQQGENYKAFLEGELQKTKDYARLRDIALAADKAKLDLNQGEAKSVNSLTSKPIYLDVKIDTTSINAIENQLKALQEKFKSVRTQNERDVLQVKIDAKQKELDIARNGINEQQNLYENFHTSLSSLKNQELRDYIDYWQKKLNIAKKGSDAAKEAEANIEAASGEIATNTADTIREIGAVFGEASQLAQKFGDEDMAQLLDQLQGVADGVASTVAGLVSGNPLDVAKGVLKTLSSAISVEVVSDTAKFEKEIDRMEKAIEDLNYVISKSVGTDKITNRIESIKELKEKQELLDKAREAEKAAEKQVKLLGITIGKKGKGSGTSQEKLDQIAEEAKQAERNVIELKRELNELYTGTTSQNITDSIVEGFRNGKFAVVDFAKSFGDMMKDAMLKNFKLKFIKNEVDDFYKSFAGAGKDSKYTEAEIKALRAMYASLIQGAQDDIGAINDILNASGIGDIGEEAKDNREGYKGAIKTVTEDTAGLLAGYMNALRLDVRQGLTIAIQNSQYLSEIANNTRYNRYLENIDKTMTTFDGRMSTIESSVLEFEAKG